MAVRDWTLSVHNTRTIFRNVRVLWTLNGWGGGRAREGRGGRARDGRVSGPAKAAPRAPRVSRREPRAGAA
ncbi:hypothetical protein MTE01_01570 [Microbacterium testaceum]|uniref:Uncharacterized protein n=1 Tax=Microbacterium testaceum TaxID=2033 RepID=A0A4Y3QGD5_MICTE|nr:hypothetical protein MTE01_01570 [Microbacterium testaceum]